MEFQAQWLFLACISFILFYVYQKPKPPIRLPPGPKPLPIFGSLFVLGANPHRSLAILAKAHGPLMSLKLGQVTTIVISSPTIAGQVLGNRDKEFCARSVPEATRTLGHHSVSLAWLPVGPQWKELRRVCSTLLFSNRIMSHQQHNRQLKVKELVSFVSARSSIGEVVDIGRAAFTTILNLLSNTFFSIDLVDLNSRSGQGFRDLMWGIMEEIGSSNLADFFPLLWGIDIQGRRRRTSSHFRKLHGIFDDLIDQRLTGEKMMDDFLSNLIKYYVEQQGLDLPRQTIRSLLTDLFVGGSDTSSNTVEWAMAELLRNPRCMTICRTELAATFTSSDNIEESKLLQLPYLQAIVKETFRLHPPAPFLLPRRVDADTELCGYTVPRGARILVNAWAIGRDDTVWAEPNEFRPERFLDSGVDYRGRDFELIPFGAGRRICPGLPLAFRAVHLMLASFVLPFEWTLPEGMSPSGVEMTERFGLTLAKVTPVRAIPTSKV